jgi:hypothetical protein
MFAACLATTDLTSASTATLSLSSLNVQLLLHIAVGIHIEVL